MTITKYNPEFNVMRPESFSSVLDRFFNDSLMNAAKRNEFVPQVDISENDKNYTIEVAVPGMKKEDFKIDINNKVLEISGERKMNNEVKEENFHSIETSYGSFKRSFRLPEEVSESKISATYKDGILELLLPKSVEKKLKYTIPVK